MSFSGFPQTGLDFFKKLRKKNTREWFEAHKDDYLTQCRAPMEEFVVEVNQALAKFAPEHIAEPKKAIYRIYRDTRFSANKTPYKTHIAAYFPRTGMDKNVGAGFYFTVSDEKMEIAAGVHMAGAEQLAAIRGHILDTHAELKKIATNKKTVELMGALKGESLRKVPRGFPAESAAADFLRMKQWIFFESFDPAVALTPESVPFVTSRLKAMASLVNYLNTPLLRMVKERTAEGMF